MEITKREVIFSIIIIAAMIGIGNIIGSKITKRIHDKNEVYNKSVTIESDEMFKYGLDTNIGDSFTYGRLYAVDTVSVDDVMDYMYISRELERYQKHYRTVTKTHRNYDGSTYTTSELEEYWTWDSIRTDKFYNTMVNFCGINFPTKDFPIPNSYYLKTVGCGVLERYNYRVVDKEYYGTLFADLDNNYICQEKNKAKFMQNVSIDEALEKFTISPKRVLLFWIPWSLLIIGAVFLFYYFDNKWLD